LLDHLRKQGSAIPGELTELLNLLHEKKLLRFAKSRDGGKGSPEVKRYLPAGRPLQDLILDIPPLNSQSKERLGYPTQKPTELIDRIILASSREGDVVFDPFCGCGTTLFSAHALKRRWIGCDIAILPIQIATRTLKERFDLESGVDFSVLGIPSSVEEAELFSQKSPEQFSHWAVEFVGGLPVSRATEDDFDGFIFDRHEAGSGAFPLIVRPSLRRPDIDRLRFSRENGAFPDGLGIITVSPPSQAALAELQHASRTGSAAAGLQVLSLRDIIEHNERFVLPSTKGHRYVDATEPLLI
jgi:hypothetical protein